ncbi:MAG: hypothetical protein HQQ74_10160, partial [Methanoculleus bourgensis]|nr:hypothetical protein [Methanoculleus bourgensis]
MTVRPSSGMASPPGLPCTGRCWPRPLLVVAVLSLLLVQGVAAVPLVVAAGDSSPAFAAQADYTCDGIDDQVEIQAALAALPDGGTVILADGTFNCSGSVNPAAGTTLLGQGPDATFLKFSRNGRLNVS